MRLAEQNITDALVGFARLLRERGVVVGPGQVVRYKTALAELDVTRLEDLFWAGRTCLVSGRRDVSIYNRSFGDYFLGPGRDEVKASIPGLEASAEHADGPDKTSPAFGDLRRVDLAIDDPRGHGDEVEQTAMGAVASQAEILRLKLFDAPAPAELEAFRKLERRLGISLPKRDTRRTLVARQGARLDLRRTVRQSFRTQGELVRRGWRQPRRRARPVVMLLDVSGSMSSNSRQLLWFAYALSRSGAAAEVFCFGTRFSRITEQLRHRDLQAAVTAASRSVVDWDGGTRIGNSLQQFLHDWGRRSFLRGALVLICSDGLECGDPAVLGTQMARLWRLTYRIVWINPLKDDPAFRPVTRGMQAALPYIDVLVGCQALQSDPQLSKLLAGVR